MGGLTAAHANDPADFLGRAPELGRFAAVPSVQRAIESGDARKLRRALHNLRWESDDERTKAELIELADDPRLFGEATRRSLARKLFPILGAAVGVVLLVGAGHAVWRLLWPELHVLNALDVPVVVQLNRPGERVEITLAPGERRVRRLFRGTYDTVARRSSGEALETLALSLDGVGFGIGIYNVLGAAPIYTDVVTYGREVNVGPRPSDELFAGEHFKLLVGQRFFVQRDVRFLFEAPPDTLLLSNSDQSRFVRLDVFDGGWKTSVDALAMSGRHGDAEVLLERIRVAQEATPKERTESESPTVP